jgi:hypothetical protein
MAQSLDMAGSESNSVDPQAPQPDTTATDPAAAPPLSAAVQRFRSCRWRETAEDGVPDHCAHRDVQPIAGTSGFVQESWCPDCGLYKVRRTPRKPTPQPGSDRIYY